MPNTQTIAPSAPVAATEEKGGKTAGVGIDVSKDKLDVCLLDGDGQPFSSVFSNDQAGIRELLGWLRKKGTAETVPCVMESTGDYHLRSALMLAGSGFAVKVINPLITAKHQKGSVRNAKSDPIDARRLARIGLLEPELPLFSPNKDNISAKKMASYLNQLEKVKQRLRDGRKQMKSARDTLGVEIDLTGTDEALRALNDQIAYLKQEIARQAPPEAEQLARACPGVSKEKMAVLLSLLSEKEFSGRDKVVAFAGLDVGLRKSGKWQGRQKLTKRGNPQIRKILFQIAWGLKQHHPEYREYYEKRYRREGKHYTTVMLALARKFLKFLYAYYWQRTVTL
jgi:transposase